MIPPAWGHQAEELSKYHNITTINTTTILLLLELRPRDIRRTSAGLEYKFLCKEYQHFLITPNMLEIRHVG